MAAQISLAEGFSGKPFQMPERCAAEPSKVFVLPLSNPTDGAVTTG